MSTSAGPLAGLRVLEFVQIAAGPFAGSLLADLGADVVKVERPDGGDGMRQWPPLLHEGDGEAFSGNFAAVNRNKRSITVDIKDQQQIARFRRLSMQCDVFIENFRPGVLAKSGLGYDDLKRDHAQLIYCSITGYGQAGPYAKKGAFDVTVQAMSGVMSVTGEAGRPPVKCGVPVGDFVAGLYAAYSIVAFAARAKETGIGAYIDCSLLGALLGVSALQTSEYFGTGVAPARLGSAHPRNAPYQAFDASDRRFAVAAGNDKLWRGLCDLVGLADLADDPRFLSQSLRAANQRELAAILQPRFLYRTAAAWCEELDRIGVPCSPINDFAEILADPHVHAMGLVRPLELPNGAAFRTVGFPVSISGFNFEIRRSPPRLGEHNDEVFREWESAGQP